MVGNSYSDSEIYASRELGDKILELENYSGQGFENISLTIRRGEVVGFTGLKGAGISELMQTIFGVMPSTSGKLTVDGKEATGGIHKAMVNKIAMIAANRKENSILPDFTLMENNYVSEHTLSAKKQLIKKKQEIEKFMNMRKLLNIRCNGEEDLITSLSGGNQQKVILARWLNTNADILLMDNPTQGIDVGAKAVIYKLILQLAEQGKTILVNTLEIPELQKVADRCVVFYHGNIQSVLSHEEITEEKVMLAATNAINAAEGAVG
jgi:ribose transport system ATP-binding protein